MLRPAHGSTSVHQGLLLHIGVGASVGGDSVGSLASPVFQLRHGSYERQSYGGRVLEKPGGHGLTGDVAHGQQDNSVFQAPFGYLVRLAHSQ